MIFATNLCRKKQFLILLNLFFVLIGLFIPVDGMAAGLGEAGSLTLDGLMIGLVVLGVIFLIFMGLLLLAKVREYSSQLKDNETHTVHFKPEDIMNMSTSEINLLLHDRKAHKDGDN